MSMFSSGGGGGSEIGRRSVSDSQAVDHESMAVRCPHAISMCLCRAQSYLVRGPTVSN